MKPPCAGGAVDMAPVLSKSAYLPYPGGGGPKSLGDGGDGGSYSLVVGMSGLGLDNVD